MKDSQAILLASPLFLLAGHQIIGYGFLIMWVILDYNDK